MRKRSRVAFALLAVGGLGVLYVFVLEPRWLEVTHHEVHADVERPLRIAFLGDLHTKAFGGIERRVLSEIAAAKPDIILLGGDLVHSDGARAPVEQFLAALPEAPLGRWMVPGNWEYWALGYARDRFYEAGRARWLVDTATTVRSDVWLVGLDDATASQPNPEKALQGRPESGLRLGLMHSPSGAAALIGKVDVILAAHTHGGQVRLPLKGELILPPGTGGYVMGWYAENGTRLFVTRGIGMSVLAARFLCRPELAIIDILPRKS